MSRKTKKEASAGPNILYFRRLFVGVIYCAADRGMDHSVRRMLGLLLGQ